MWIPAGHPCMSRVWAKLQLSVVARKRSEEPGRLGALILSLVFRRWRLKSLVFVWFLCWAEDLETQATWKRASSSHLWQTCPLRKSWVCSSNRRKEKQLISEQTKVTKSLYSDLEDATEAGKTDLQNSLLKMHGNCTPLSFRTQSMLLSNALGVGGSWF